jgi:GGDEF domain-containing protein
VAVIEVVVLDDAGAEPSRTAVDAIAGSLAQLLRSSMRETDRIARMGPTRFNVLLPETSRAEARRFAERARRAGEVAFSRETLRLVLKIAIAAPGRDETLAEALATAEGELAH